MRSPLRFAIGHLDREEEAIDGSSFLLEAAHTNLKTACKRDTIKNNLKKDTLVQSGTGKVVQQPALLTTLLSISAF
jgi:hypothetical protein